MDDGHLVLTRSLELEVRAAFALQPRTEGLTGEALIEALSKLQIAENQTLLSALADQGRGLVGSEPAAVLDWVDAAFARWQSHYSLDPELARLLLEVRPLTAAAGRAAQTKKVVGKRPTQWYCMLGTSAPNMEISVSTKYMDCARAERSQTLATTPVLGRVDYGMPRALIRRIGPQTATHSARSAGVYATAGMAELLTQMSASLKCRQRKCSERVYE